MFSFGPDYFVKLLKSGSIQKYSRVKREAICPTAEGWPKSDHAAGCTAANLELNG